MADRGGTLYFNVCILHRSSTNSNGFLSKIKIDVGTQPSSSEQPVGYAFSFRSP